MCIALLSTVHPDYALVLLSNRDEYLSRPTAPAAWWPAADHQVLSGRDLLRETRGAWLGITQHGRLAVLTNFREDSEPDAALANSIGSRGEIPKTILMSDPAQPLNGVVADMVSRGVQGVGGFTLIFGDIARQKANEAEFEARLGIISNRTGNDQDIIWLDNADSKAVALSNSHYGDEAWPKVAEGRRLLDELIAKSTASDKPLSQDELIEEALALLSTDSMPQSKTDDEWEAYSRQLRRSIFIPPLFAEERAAEDVAAAKDGRRVRVFAVNGHGSGKPKYGTQKQSVMLVSRAGRVTFVERTLFDADVQAVKQDLKFEFDLGST